MTHGLLMVVPQPGETYGYYAENGDRDFPSVIFLSKGVDRSGPERIVHGKLYQVIGDVSRDSFEAFDALSETMTLVQFNELFSSRRLKIISAASGVVG